MVYVRDGNAYRPRPDLGTSSTELCVIEISRPKYKMLVLFLLSLA